MRARPLSSCVCRPVPVLAGLNVGLSVDAVVARLLRLWFCRFLGRGPCWLLAPCLGCSASFSAAWRAGVVVVSSLAVGLGRLRGAVVGSCQWRSAGRCLRRVLADARPSLIERSVVVVVVAMLVCAVSLSRGARVVAVLKLALMVACPAALILRLSVGAHVGRSQ